MEIFCDFDSSTINCHLLLQFRPRGILEKYDEEIEGVNKKSFRLGIVYSLLFAIFEALSKT